MFKIVDKGKFIDWILLVFTFFLGLWMIISPDGVPDLLTISIGAWWVIESIVAVIVLLVKKDVDLSDKEEVNEDDDSEDELTF